jgi:hypothetical protein
MKLKCLENPEEHLWKATKHLEGVKTIFRHIKALEFEDRPNYSLVQEQLQSLFQTDVRKAARPASQEKVTLGKKRKVSFDEQSNTSSHTQASEGSVNKMMPPQPKRQRVEQLPATVYAKLAGEQVSFYI